MKDILTDKYKAFLFDFDGTLVETETLHHAGFTSALKEVGIEYITFEQHCSTYLGTGAKFIIASELKKHGKENDYSVDDIIARKKIFFKEILKRDGIKTVNGSINFLNSAKARGFRIALVSGGIKESILDVIKTTGIPDVFEEFITPADVAKPKPDPEGYLLAANKLGVQPEDCLVFEDALNGIESAKRAGMKSVGITTYISKDRLLEVDPSTVVVKDFTELS
jgi:beta-phosphoglucomutase